MSNSNEEENDKSSSSSSAESNNSSSDDDDENHQNTPQPKENGIAASAAAAAANGIALLSEPPQATTTTTMQTVTEGDGDDDDGHNEEAEPDDHDDIEFEEGEIEDAPPKKLVTVVPAPTTTLDLPHSNRRLEGRLGLCMPVGRVTEQLRDATGCKRVAKDGRIAMAAAMEGLVEYVLEQSENALPLGPKSQKRLRSKITPIELLMAQKGNPVMIDLLSNTVISDAGVLPHMPPGLVGKGEPQKRKKRKQRPKKPAVPTATSGKKKSQPAKKKKKAEAEETTAPQEDVESEGF